MALSLSGRILWPQEMPGQAQHDVGSGPV